MGEGGGGGGGGKKKKKKKKKKESLRLKVGPWGRCRSAEHVCLAR